MNGVHDLGGTDGLGPVVREQDEPVWHADWEKVCFALFPTNAVKGFFGVDEFRFGIEQMHPAEYLLSPYYEHWLHTAEHYTVKAGVIAPGELGRRTQSSLEPPAPPVPEKKAPEPAALMEPPARRGAPARRDSDRPARFAVGDRVR